MSYLCYSCGYQSKYKANVRAHMKTHAGEIPYAYKTFDRWSTAAAADLRSHMMSQFEDKPYELGSFDFGGERTGDFEKHYHTGRKLQKCGLCDYKTDKASNLRAHMKIHSVDEENECELCDDNEPSGHKTHMRTHAAKSACRSCSCRCNGTSFTSLVKNHTVDNPSCGICDHRSTSLSSSHLKKHVATLVKRLLKGYIGEKRFACDLCDCSSNQTEHVGTLVRTLNGGKPHLCVSCDCRSTALRACRRTRSDENPYACGLSDYRCNQGGELSLHRRTLTKEKPDDCKLCEYESSQSSCGSREYRSIKSGDLKKRTKTRSKKKPHKPGPFPFDYRFNQNAQFTTPFMPPYAYDGFPGYLWNPAGDMKTKSRSKIVGGDAMPYAVVLVTGDPQW